MAIMMTDSCTALAGACPVAAGLVALLPGEISHTVSLGTGQDVMFIRLGTAAFNLLAVFVNGCPQHDIWADMKLVKIARNQLSICVVLWPLSDPAARRNTTFAFFLRAQIGVPATSLGTGSFSQFCAMRICACKPTEIGAVTHTGARDKKSHRVRLLRHGTRHTDQQRHGGNRHCFQYVHPSPLAGGFARLAIHVSIEEAARILRKTRYPEQ